MNLATSPFPPARALLAVCALSIFSGAVLSQTRPVAYPQGGTAATWGFTGPLGEACNGNPTAQEARTHILFPAEYLPTRSGTIWALQHRTAWLTACGNLGSTVNYALLEVTLAHRPRGAGPLSTVFANNLPSPPPAPVFSQPWIKTWNLGQWDSIPFAQGFSYNGVDDIVVEIRKIVTPTPSPGFVGQSVATVRNLNPPRADLPRQVQRGGGPGTSNAVDGNYNDLLGWRLRFDGVSHPTLEVRSPLGPNNLHFENGTLIHFRIFDSQNDIWALGASFDFSPVPIPVPGVGGAVWLLPPPVTLGLGAVTHAPNTVYQRVNWQIPTGTWLAGLRICAQAVTFHGTTYAPDMTNAVDFIIR